MTTGPDDLSEPAPDVAPARPVVRHPAAVPAPSGLGAGDIVVGVLVAALGVLGLILGLGAVDDEMAIFGLSLFGFAVVFIGGLVRGVRGRQRAGKSRSEAEARTTTEALGTGALGAKPLAAESLAAESLGVTRHV